jgi:hypothetical protein
VLRRDYLRRNRQPALGSARSSTSTDDTPTTKEESHVRSARALPGLLERDRRTGRAAIEATIATVQAQFPGFVFSAVGSVDAHHNQARFNWGLGPAGDEPIVLGFDVVVLDEDGRIDVVLGFLDKVPA